MKLYYALPLCLLLACGSEQGSERSGNESNDTALARENTKPSSSRESTERIAAEPVTVTVDASSYENPIFLKFEEGLIVAEQDSAWDLSVKRTQFQTNSGTSGDGAIGVFHSGKKDFEAVNECVFDALAYDEELPVPGPPGSGTFSGNPILNDWYDYDFATHSVTSKGDVYLVTDENVCFKLQILGYSRGVFEIRTASLPLP
ncbi:HmuY family protein [Pseudobacteriovorax antillogorgiicola]|uniref:HmuY protein n=1 Tax=Pseudobacteriovorax antillogorgiicola TaxID=1513793 RepID=A0A1Y6CFU1_9BACT|nr:HmuY family protein [Pseudobacteriovorax antillogorgiicola]TCS49022.1 heme-binding HmuY-like protein [Pseudobacteriovorax antillogorgiicola]SMF52893.1 HmuY protein [Pseudobacteriovorax antillogorgiicola]